MKNIIYIYIYLLIETNKAIFRFTFFTTCVVYKHILIYVHTYYRIREISTVLKIKIFE